MHVCVHDNCELDGFFFVCVHDDTYMYYYT